MTEAEKRIWEAAYAAAYVRAFYDELRMRHESGQGSFDEVGSHVEQAMTVADKALEELRRWKREEGDGFYEYLKTGP